MNNINIDKLFLKYNKALEILNNKFTQLYKEYPKELEENNPIDYIKCRIKSKKSIEDKLQNKKKLMVTVENVEETLNDIAGVRIICPFLKDINKIINFVNNDLDLEVIKVKNYIDNPKINGYSSYHMIVSLPVSIDGVTELVKAEIQIRTLAMDVVASLEHKIRYKKHLVNKNKIEPKLQKIVNFVNLIDLELNNFIQDKINYYTNKDIKKIQYPNLQFNNFFEKYILAMKQVEKTITNFKNDYIMTEGISPVEHIESRIKQPISIINKLIERNKEITFENIEYYINDISAIKVVCSFLSDANKIIEVINNNSDFVILDRQDYITEPKESGYSSYHFVVAIPVKVNDQISYVKTEIQVRTIIMDFWANIEHILCYKKEVNKEMKEHLKKIANNLRIIEYEMDDLAQITINQNTYTYNHQKYTKKRILNKNKITNSQN